MGELVPESSSIDLHNSINLTKDSIVSLTELVPRQIFLPPMLEKTSTKDLASSRTKSLTSSVVFISSFDYTPHPPIEVGNDSSLAALAISGSGLISDPYVLEGWKITTVGIHGIYIYDTTAHFVIRNCLITTGNITDIHGIYIRNVSTGTISIENNVCQNNFKGIFVQSSNKSSIGYNTCHKNSVGISLQYSGSSTVGNNICYLNKHELRGGYGIHIEDSDYSTVTDNTCTQNNNVGIRFDIAKYSTIVNNTCHNNGRGISLGGSEYSNVVNNK
ncbi:MAG: NosD domain-containing protein, partial [Promethearchaeota archaeon]